MSITSLSSSCFASYSHFIKILKITHIHFLESMIGVFKPYCVQKTVETLIKDETDK